MANISSNYSTNLRKTSTNNVTLSMAQIFKKEQIKAQKRAQNLAALQGNGNVEELDDSMEEGHPYIKMAFNKEYLSAQDLLKTATLPADTIKDFQHKEKNLLTELPDPQAYILANGIELNLKKAFGQYQHPIQKPIHFISKTTLIYFVGNYLAVHNLAKDETKYVGIDQNLQEITALEVQTVDTIIKGFSFAPIPQQVQVTTTSQSPKKDYTLTSPTSTLSPSPGNNVSTQKDSETIQVPVSSNNKEMLTLIAYSERAKETYIRESKYGQKKVYGITNSQRKKTSSKTNKGQKRSQSSHPNNNQSLPEFNLDEGISLRYLLKVNVFTLNNPSKRYVLSHLFDEYFYVQQIHLREKESLCYTLCCNEFGEQIFFIWNFRKETVIGFVEMKARINKFMVHHLKSELILFLGQHYLKYYEANFTNKLIKENTSSIIPMKIEKESNFVDIDQFPKQDLFVVITDNNCAFVYENGALKFKLLEFMNNQRTILEECDSVRSDSLEIGEVTDELRGDEHLCVQSKGTSNRVKQKEQKQQKTKDKIMTQDDDEDHKLGKGDRKLEREEELQFMKVIVTQKGFVIGTNIGYIFYYEFQKDDVSPKLVSKAHISNKIKGIVSMSLNRGCVNDDFYIALAGVYPKSIKSKLVQQVVQNQNNRHMRNRKRSVDSALSNRINKSAGLTRTKTQNFFMHKFIRDPTQDRPQNAPKHSMFNQRKGSNKDSLRLVEQQEIEERLELMVFNMKNMRSSQLHQVVEKIHNKGAHDGSIYQVAQARNRSSFYTIGEGNVLKIWNHTNEWKGVASFVFDEQPISVDVHPSSWQIALGFKSSVKIYQILDKQLKLSFEKFGKACLAITYADGGQLLACTNAAYIEIIDPMRMQLLMTLFGHTGLVRSLHWTHNSQYLISTCMNGSLLVWRGNFKEQMTCNGGQDVNPLCSTSDKNCVYLNVVHDETLDVMIGLTTGSMIRILMNNGQECIHEEELVPRDLFAENTLKATCMAFCKELRCIAVGLSNGRIQLINWPLTPNKKHFKYEVHLQNTAITDILFSYSKRYLVATSDDGNVYVMETYRIQNGIEKNWIAENHERQLIQKKRETNGFRGFSITDQLVMCNQYQLVRVAQRIQDLEKKIKSQETRFHIRATLSKEQFNEQMKMINLDLQEELTKQEKLIEASKIEFAQERDKLERIRDEQLYEHNEEKTILVQNKENNLNFVSNENDELESRIVNLKSQIIGELDRIEGEHTEAVGNLVTQYEQSIRQAQEEIGNTINKLKQNGQYYESMMTLQEKEYEGEIGRFQGNLVEAQNDFQGKKNDLEEKISLLKVEHQVIEEDYKDNNYQKKQKLAQVFEMEAEFKFKQSNIERLGEKQVNSEAFIEDKDKAILDSAQEQRQLENLIVFLSQKIKELKKEKRPQEEKKREMELLIENTYKELQEEFKFRKFMQLKEEGLLKKMSILNAEIKQNSQMKENIDAKVYIFKRELSYLSEAQSVKGWDHKMRGMLKCMNQVLNALTANEVKLISTQFIHIAEVIESNSRNYKRQDEEDMQAKQYKMNEMELAYYRNKNSEKLTEMQFRFKNLFSQLEKQVKKLRNDNVKLIEEFNTLTNEHKKLNNLRRMIKESIREIMGDNLKDDMLNSSDEDNFKGAPPMKRKKMQRSMSSAQLSSRQVVYSQTGEAVTAREMYQSKGQLPEVRQPSYNGASTQREIVTGLALNKKVSHRRQISHTNSKILTLKKETKVNNKYLDKIVQEFQKNKQEIENQTKAMENIQRQMNAMLSANPILMPNSSVPMLNLKGVNQFQGNQSKVNTMTTRIPMTTDRTTGSGASSLLLDPGSNIVSQRKLSTIKESKGKKEDL